MLTTVRSNNRIYIQYRIILMQRTKVYFGLFAFAYLAASRPHLNAVFFSALCSKSTPSSCFFQYSIRYRYCFVDFSILIPSLCLASMREWHLDYHYKGIVVVVNTTTHDLGEPKHELLTNYSLLHFNDFIVLVVAVHDSSAVDHIGLIVAAAVAYQLVLLFQLIQPS